jgi:hypothetical protein
MANTDWAIVVGVQTYPGLSSLGGPKNDAENFCEWLLDGNGGAVDQANVQLIVTPPKKHFLSAKDARPTEEKVRLAAEAIQDQANKNLLKTGQKYVGRRLYLYFAGHGFSPRTDQTALLMANATKQHVGPPYHWLGDYTANWFWQAGYFDEILLFMDCCRENYDVPQVNIPWLPEMAADFKERVKRFYAFATGWTLLSRELPDQNGTVRGVFTRALVAGLRKEAVEANSNRVTTRSLQKYLTDSLPALKDSDFITDDFVITTVGAAPPGFPVKIKTPAQAAGRRIELWDSTRLVDSTQANGAGVWQVNLGKGLYKALIPDLGLKQLFEVNGAGEPDVEFN